MTKTISFLFMMALVSMCFAQEEETELLYNVHQSIQYQKEKSFGPGELRGGGSLQLPFFDDFSRYSLPTEDPEIPVDWQRWEDDHAYINETFPIEPPSIGVATLDGLDRTGYPYVINVDGNEHFSTDTLTSLPIDLSDFSSTDDVYLTFFYQAGGRGNEPDIEDSLIVEFFVDVDEFGQEVWSERWKIPGMAQGEFQQAFIKVEDAVLNPFFYTDDFRFRFRAKSEGSGNVDHWHIDYVVLDEDIDPDNYVIEELAIMDPVSSILNQEYTSMPWTHFVSNPSGYMLPGNTILKERNLNTVSYNFRSGYRVEYQEDGLVWDMPNDFVNTSGNESSIIDTQIAINGEPNNFVFDDTVNDTCAVFDVKFYHEVVSDGTQQNDTTSYRQIFTNYYAYDDGSVESGWFLNVAGGRVAVKHQSVIPDTLLGLLIHFTPFREDVTDEIFLLRAWANDDGEPGDQLSENYASQNPEFFSDGYNIFKYYEYDDPIPVDGSFFCGFVQSAETKLLVGNDKNTNTNPFNLFYSLGASASWQQSEVEGSLMIRPVLRAGKSEDNVGIMELEKLDFSIYPNPVKDVFTVQSEISTFDWTISDASGRIVLSGNSTTDRLELDVSALPIGMYIVQFQSENGIFGVEKFIKE